MNPTFTRSINLPEPKFASFLSVSTTETLIGRDLNIFNLEWLYIRNVSETPGEVVMISKKGVPFAPLAPGMGMVFPVIRPPTPGSIASGDFYVATSATGAPTLSVSAYMLS